MKRSRSNVFAVIVVAAFGIIAAIVLASHANAWSRITPTLFRMWLVDERASQQKFNVHGKLWVDSETGTEYFETPSGSITVLVDEDGKPCINEGWREWKESGTNGIEHY